MDLLVYLGFCAVSFGKHTIGVVVTPYQTYRSLIEKGKWGELFYIGLICSVYFAFASLVKTPYFHPFFLTQQFMVLFLGAVLGYILVIGLINSVSLWKMKKQVSEGVLVAWGYSLVPTFLWFFSTSILYVLLPPPRTESGWGVLFSLLYLTMSAVLFFWKAELYYLTLRFGLQLDLTKIIAVSAIIIPVMCGYSLGMYKLGIFRIPFV